MAKPMSKSKIVSHMADKIGTPKKVAAQFFEELFKLAVKEAKGGAGKFVISEHRTRGEGAPEGAPWAAIHRPAKRSRSRQRQLLRLPRGKSVQRRNSSAARRLFRKKSFSKYKAGRGVSPWFEKTAHAAVGFVAGAGDFTRQSLQTLILGVSTLQFRRAPNRARIR